MYCWKNWFAISGEAVAKLLTRSNATDYQRSPFDCLISDILLRPRSAISRIVCLTAQRIESLTSLN